MTPGRDEPLLLGLGPGGEDVRVRASTIDRHKLADTKVGANKGRGRQGRGAIHVLAD